MTNAVIVLIVGIVGAAFAFGAVRLLRQAALDLGLVHYPTSERQVHTGGLPRIGGLAIFLGFVVAVGFSFTLPVERFPEELERIILLLTGASVVVLVMLYDDLVGIRPIPKLLWQIGAAGIVILPRIRGEGHGIVIDQFNNPFGGTVELTLLIAIPFTFLWIVGMMNTLNWVDGLDGLAGSITLVAATVLFLHTYFRPSGDPQFTISLLALAFAAAIIGFLPYNWHPAKIIMGDTGAMFLGFTLAVISIIGGAKIATALLALWLPIVDVAWVIVYRVINGRSPMNADRGHLHHRLLDFGWGQRQIVLFFAGLSSLFGMAALLIPWAEVKLVILVLGGVTGIALLALLAKQSSTAKRVQSGTAR